MLKYTSCFVLAFIALFITFLPVKPINNQQSFSKILFANNGDILSARVSGKDEWHFEADSTVPNKLAQAVICFEDQHFYYHMGVNPFSLIRASYQYIKTGEIVSGGSTIDMQYIRLINKHKNRNIFNKILEIYLALKLNLIQSKTETLIGYLSMAPYGGNIVGAKAAAYKYFGRPLTEISWAEAATLAIIPNAPGRINTFSKQEVLLKKRNHLLLKLKRLNRIDETDYSLAVDEPLLANPTNFNNIAPHLIDYLISEYPNKNTFYSTIDLITQQRTQLQINNYLRFLKRDLVHNASAIIIENKTGKCLAYIGNGTELFTPQKDVDNLISKRSYGSLLKPLLYSKLFDKGIIHPNSILLDVPRNYNGYHPRNFFRTYSGLVPAQLALSQSLNVPAVQLLSDYGIEQFFEDIKDVGFTSFNNPASHYGLPIIVGGGEAKGIELATHYASMADKLNNAEKPVESNNHFNLKILINSKNKITMKCNLSAEAIYQTFEALTNLDRPDEWNYVHSLKSQKKVAWKTGTSFGFRDAWAVGCTPEHTVLVWVGNSDGTPRPEISGVKAAAPLLFKIFDVLNSNKYFVLPQNFFTTTDLCEISGYQAGINCNKTVNQRVTVAQSEKLGFCEFCQTINNYNNHSVIKAKLFVPPTVALPYLLANSTYLQNNTYFTNRTVNTNTLKILYPLKNARLTTKNKLGNYESAIVFRAAASQSDTLYWFLNNDLLGTTTNNHSISAKLLQGKYKLNVISATGNYQTVNFTAE